MHDDAYIGELSENNIKCVVHDDLGWKQLDIFCRVTGFTSDFLGFILVELIRFFHGAILIAVTEYQPYLHNEKAYERQAWYADGVL